MFRNHTDEEHSLKECMKKLSRQFLSPLDLLPHADTREKFIDLVLNGEPKNIELDIITQFHELREILIDSKVDDARVVVFGGGTGLSNVIGGDSRMPGWSKEPFFGLKEIFPQTRSIVCVTDDGGSTGELLKDIPLIALGDIRHVLLSSIQLRLLQSKYGITILEAQGVVSSLADIFNLRFKNGDLDLASLLSLCEEFLITLPSSLKQYIETLIHNIFEDPRLRVTSTRAHCLGNLLLASAVYANISTKYDNEKLEKNHDIVAQGFYEGISKLTKMIGAVERAVLPCTITPSQLRIRYLNGVLVTGEGKSANATRGYPVDRVYVDFSDTISTSSQIFEDIKKADIIIMAPGSLYSSIIPIFQVPGMAAAVRQNHQALKMLISNLWVQTGETDRSILDPERKFHVSDMIRAYERNIPGGIRGLFHDVLCLSLKDVPASILQNYAVEGKIPIYLDKSIVSKQGLRPIECGIYSKKALAERGVIQHDPEILAQAVKTIYVGTKLLGNTVAAPSAEKNNCEVDCSKIKYSPFPSGKYRKIAEIINTLPITSFPEQKYLGRESDIRSSILDIIWKHQDIPLSHLNYVKALLCVDQSEWQREQKWDKVFSFYDPTDCTIKIRSDQFEDKRKLEVAFLIALGQSLLGNYAEKKDVKQIKVSKRVVGKVYHLQLRDPNDMDCYYSPEELQQYLKFARMQQSPDAKNQFTRLINANEGFTPPGLLMGLLYAWYLDNRLATHIEYKMAVMQISKSDLIPEQQKMLGRRKSLIRFFREVVFCH